MHGDGALVKAFLEGQPRALARAISRSEAGAGAQTMRALYGRTGRAMTIGFTGPPGVGKSTLIGALIALVRRQAKTVGVVSVDPSSPFSHGAILGDRIRLAEHFTDTAVFIRSMASRGHLGGLAGATGDAVALMDAFGKDVVIVETVGVGQSEIEIAQLADTTVVALQPGSGDSVQLLKAGILEVADIFVVNKSDHPMALQLRREIRSMLEMLEFPGWEPPVVSTQATQGGGVGELWDAIAAHRDYLVQSGERTRKRRAAFLHQARQLAMGRMERRVDAALGALDTEPVQEADPYAAAERIVASVASSGEPAPPAESPAAPLRATVKGL
ncbi:MAG: methylmalonyl Co-A mutase-associated GTPase MeaB [Candidatus Eremiobacteraeota bacterium]|nr:methylmalonyl Co-A mutase-associated GTPase MeaB [Candidatus Eremiobacteraeota bacterium]MBV9648031.1 methylmalonyl Co-A mutase-associated GTPase MeaB [Candidatus Eremiobacteraeota bacterium]